MVETWKKILITNLNKKSEDLKELVNNFQKNNETTNKLKAEIEAKANIAIESVRKIAKANILLSTLTYKHEVRLKFKDEDWKRISGNLKEIADFDTYSVNTLTNVLKLKINVNPLQLKTWEVKFHISNRNDKMREIVLHFVSQTDDFSEGEFSLVSIIPRPKNFDNIKDFLYKTQDICGFLYISYKDFNSK